MTGCKVIIIVCVSLLFSNLFSVPKSVHSFELSSESKLSRSGFVLPQKPETQLTRAEQKGKALYEYYCALCHGKTGKGDGFNSYNLDPPPAKHADPARMKARSDSQLRIIIRKGGRGLGLSPLMPAWAETLTDKQVADLIAYIRTLSRQAKSN